MENQQNPQDTTKGVVALLQLVVAVVMIVYSLVVLMTV
jgi:hypothetical protein